MSLYLVEFTPTSADAAAVETILEFVAEHAELIEAQVTADHAQVFTIVEAENVEAVAQQFTNAPATEISEPAEVRLVGAELDEVKAARPTAGYLVEWDIPAHLDMDTYLSRKADKTPLYAEIPEVSFLRTYVREDMGKCLCFYDAPDEDAVVRAREIVSTPVDRLHALKGITL